MTRDLRTREELKRLPCLAPVAEHPEFTTLDIADLRMLARVVECAGSIDAISDATVAEVGAGSPRRLDSLQRALRRLLGRDHPASVSVSVVLAKLRNDGRTPSRLDTRPRELILKGSHWTSLGDLASASLSMAQLRAVDRLLSGVEGPEAVTEADVLRLRETKAADTDHLLPGLNKLFGKAHPASLAAQRVRARERPYDPDKRDMRPRELVLEDPHWEKLRDLPSTSTMPIAEFRVVDRFLRFCTERRIRSIQTEDVRAFDKANVDPGPLHRLRNGLTALYGLHHPIVHVVNEVRVAKSRTNYLKTSPAPTVGQGKRPARYSVPVRDLPMAWRQALDRAEAAPARGKKISPNSLRSMRYQAQRIVWAARKAGLPEDFTVDTLSAYDRALSTRETGETRASTRSMSFRWLAAFGRLIDANPDAIAAATEVGAYYARIADLDLPLKEGRLADLDDLGAIMTLAHRLLNDAAAETNFTQRATLFTDAGALALLSLIPFRNEDTVVRWGDHVTWTNDRYRMKKDITKTGAEFTGPLHHILTPFLDALILQGRHPALLPQLREAAIAARAPVFPKSNGGARSMAGLSRRWRARVGTGSIISRTRVHTMLGELGPAGVRAALALCAQRSVRTALHYQASSLARIEMSKSQDDLQALVVLSDAELAARLDGL